MIKKTTRRLFRLIVASQDTYRVCTSIELAERSFKLLILLSHVGWQMWSGVIIWLYQICQVATLLPPPQRVLYFTLTLQPQSKWIRTQPRGGLGSVPFVTPHFPRNPGQLGG